MSCIGACFNMGSGCTYMSFFSIDNFMSLCLTGIHVWLQWDDDSPAKKSARMIEFVSKKVNTHMRRQNFATHRTDDDSPCKPCTAGNAFIPAPFKFSPSCHPPSSENTACLRQHVTTYADAALYGFFTHPLWGQRRRGHTCS